MKFYPALSFLFLVCSAFLGQACSNSSFVNFDQAVKKRASYDFNCEMERVEVRQLEKDKYEAKGCAMEGIYQIDCSHRPCSARAIKK